MTCVLRPFLNIGIIVVFLRSSGKLPVNIHLLNKSERNGVIICPISIITSFGKNPNDPLELFFNFSKFFRKTFSLIGLNTLESLYIFGQVRSGLLGIRPASKLSSMLQKNILKEFEISSCLSVRLLLISM